MKIVLVIFVQFIGTLDNTKFRKKVKLVTEIRKLETSYSELNIICFIVITPCYKMP